MKKTISILILTAMLISCCIIASFASPQDGKYNTCEENEKHAVENIEHYFVPEAYDISPFTGYSYWDPVAVHKFVFLEMYCEDFYQQKVVYDESGRISVPPMYTVFEPIFTEAITRNELPPGFVPDKYYTDFYEMRRLYHYGDNNKHNLNPSETMWQVLRDATERNRWDETASALSLDACVKAYLAPWTLYSDGNLYTWTDLMKMSDEELNQLNFESYEFEKFIKNVKPELEKRNWWKSEYETLYNKLNAHRDDYYKTQNKSEMFVFNGENIYLSKMNEEYFTVEQYPSITNIVSVDIYQPGFIEEIYKLDSDVQEKYNVLIEALESGLKTSSPSTGENTIFYLAIAAAALAAMTALVVRRKRKIVL